MLITPQSMWRSWLFIGSLVLLCAALAARGGGAPRVQEGLLSAGRLFMSVLPNLVLGFTLAGFLSVLLPADLISRTMGEQSGARGLWFGTLAGCLTPGGPFTHFPILASFLGKGAGIGPVCAYIAAWGLIGINRFVVWEWPILGFRFGAARWLASVWVPPVVGWCGAALYRAFRAT